MMMGTAAVKNLNSGAYLVDVKEYPPDRRQVNVPCALIRYTKESRHLFIASVFIEERAERLEKTPAPLSPIFTTVGQTIHSVRRDGLKRSDIASRALWPIYVTLISSDRSETGCTRNFVNRRTTWNQ